MYVRYEYVLNSGFFDEGKLSNDPSNPGRGARECVTPTDQKRPRTHSRFSSNPVTL